MTLRRSVHGVVLAAVVLTTAGPVDAPAGPAPELPAQLPPAVRAQVEPVTDKPTLAVKVEGETFVGRRDVFEFLLDHPDFATQVTRALKFARYKIWRTPSGLGIDDGWGTVGTFETVWSTPGHRMMHARGVYHHKLLPDIQGQAVVAIDYGVEPAPNGRSHISTAITGFVKLDSRVLAFASKMASSVALSKGEKEARKLVGLFAKTTQAIEADAAGVFEKVRQRPDVPARELEEFRRLLNLPMAAR
ncbi:MAG TPA: hypothetical protein VFW70_19415 [Methylomirabilota bacterium]|nr:hypothetical protein [Methylomirabilota bacterium]